MSGLTEIVEPGRLLRLLELGRGLFGLPDLDVVVERVLAAAVELTGARYAALGVVDRSGVHLERFVTVGLEAGEREAIGDLPRGHGVLGVLIRDPRPLRLADVGAHPQSYGFPLGHPPMAAFLGVPIVVAGRVFGSLYLTEKADAAEFSAQDEALMVALAEWAATAIENARRESGLRGERDLLVRRVRAFETTEEIGRALAGETGFARILELVVKRGRALVEARASVLVLPEGDELVVRAVAGEADRSLLGMQVPIEGSLSGQVFRSGRASRLGDHSGRVAPIVAFAVKARTALVIPLRFRGRCFGVLSAFDRLHDEAEFSAEDERLMEVFGSTAAVAVATARDVEEQGLRRSMQAAELERSRWARELHDQTLQDLAALRLVLGGALRATERADVDRVLRGAIEDVQVGVGALRGLITELRPAALDELGTGAALHVLIERVGALSGLEIEFDADLAYEAGRVQTRHLAELESALYRLVQEALTNVTKHADATHVRVALSEDADHVHVLVHDNGTGFDPAVASEGFGLLGMRERVTLAAGTLAFDSQPGHGTTVTARLPARREPPPAQRTPSTTRRRAAGG